MRSLHEHSEEKGKEWRVRREKNSRREILRSDAQSSISGSPWVFCLIWKTCISYNRVSFCTLGGTVVTCHQKPKNTRIAVSLSHFTWLYSVVRHLNQYVISIVFPSGSGNWLLQLVSVFACSRRHGNWVGWEQSFKCVQALFVYIRTPPKWKI